VHEAFSCSGYLRLYRISQVENHRDAPLRKVDLSELATIKPILPLTDVEANKGFWIVLVRK